MFKHSISTSMAMLALTLASSAVQANPSVSLQESQTIPESAQAQGRPPRDGKKKDLFEQLNLSEPQKQQMTTIRQKYRGDIEQTHNRLRAARQELQQLMAGDASKDSIRAKHRQVGSLRQEIDRLRFESMLEIRDVLTPAQRRELAQLAEQRRGRMRDRMGDRPEPPEPPEEL
jgi:Spy/CpxP family protein refolding chaperone